jgi:ribosomal protein S18 acetylase RimI-like enzyme/DNA-binding MarR family transcriptional regulator
MKPTEIYFELGIGTRVRRLYETLSADTDRLYSEQNLNFKVSYFYVMYALSKNDSLPISAISTLAGFSHSAVSQTVKKLVTLGYVQFDGAKDGRQKLVKLTPVGVSMLQSLSPLWKAFEAAMKEVLAESPNNFMMALTDVEAALEHKSFYDRARTQMADMHNSQIISDVDIVAYDRQYQKAFYDLNIPWLEKYFAVEPIDELVLSNPEDHILGKGGEIFFALQGAKVLGVVAMKLNENNVFELTKLAVDAKMRRGGVGKALCMKVIERFNARGGKLLYLETNTRLENAIRLYKKIGFKELPNPVDSPYERSDFYMEWQG